MPLRLKLALGMALKSNGKAFSGLTCNFPIFPVRYPALPKVFTTFGIFSENMAYFQVASPICPFWWG